MTKIPKGITRTDVLRAMAEFERGESSHAFKASQKYDLVYEGRRYPPKAVLGLAARRQAGRVLRPEDFSGGDQTNKILKGLGFEIVSKGSRPARLDRSSSATAGEVIKTLLAAAPESGRRAVLRFLGDSLRYVDRVHPERWGVTLESSHVRFNAGQTESIVLWEEGVGVLVADSAWIAGTTLSRAYPSAGGARLREIPFELAVQVLPGLRPAHESAMSSAMRRPSTRVIKDAHSPGVVAYLWDTLGMVGAPPVPAYFEAGRRAGWSQQRRSKTDLSDEAILALPDLPLTEKTAIIKQRLAQRLFRARLRANDCRCRVTGVSDPEHLRASHIKPWAKCTDRERQDPANGLLLAPHVDHLFDAGFISFEDDGTVLVSRHLDKAVLEAWGLETGKKTTGAQFPEEQAGYLAWHRRSVFEK